MKKILCLLILFASINIWSQTFIISNNLSGLLSYKKIKDQSAFDGYLQCSDATFISSSGNWYRYMRNSNDNISTFCGYCCASISNPSYTDWNKVLYNRASTINDLANNLSLQVGTYLVNQPNYNNSQSFFTQLNLNGKTYVYDSASTPIKYITFTNFPESLSVNDFVNTNLTLYPNPAQNVLNIDINQELSGCIYDLTGKKLLNFSTKTIDISQLKAGIYILDVISEDKRYIKKIIKE